MMRTGGRLLHEWLLLMSLLWRPSPSDRSPLTANLLKTSLPQNFETIFLSKNVVSDGDLIKAAAKTFDIIFSSSILKTLYVYTRRTKNEHHDDKSNVNVEFQAQIRNATRRTCFYSINSAKSELLLSSLSTILRQLSEFVYISKNDLNGKYLKKIFGPISEF